MKISKYMRLSRRFDKLGKKAERIFERDRKYEGKMPAFWFFRPLVSIVNERQAILEQLAKAKVRYPKICPLLNPRIVGE